MGNITSCFNAQSNNTAKLIDLHRKTLRHIDVPVTAAELMLEDPGCVVAPVSDFRSGFKISAMKADESLFKGRVYVLVSVGRVNRKVSESELVVIASFCGEKRAKRCISKVLPLAMEVSGDGGDNPVKLFGEESDVGRLNYRVRHWKPALEPIYERN